MARIVIAVDSPRGPQLASELTREGWEVTAVVAADAPASGIAIDAEFLALEIRRDSLPARVVADCDARGIRIVALAADEDGRRLADAHGLGAAFPLDVEGWVLAEGLTAPRTARRAAVPQAEGKVIAVWGPHGSPGRSTLAIELAAELSRGGKHVALVDADSHAPSLALSLGLADEGPGFAAACRQAERGGLDAAELTRISVPAPGAGTTLDVLTGLNRPGRWPELSEDRVASALGACRAWADHTVVDVGASLERDEEIVSDLDGPRRNGATLAAVRCADVVVAVCAADPVGIARFLRAHAELRATIGATRVVVVVNRLRGATIGVDARGQVRQTLERFAGIEQVWFVPLDPRSADAALLVGRPVADLAPRSPLAAGVRRLVGEALVPAPRPTVRARARRGARAPSRSRRLPRTA